MEVFFRRISPEIFPGKESFFFSLGCSQTLFFIEFNYTVTYMYVYSDTYWDEYLDGCVTGVKER